ncbi:MAG TPA: type II CAAX endopeptidase family protein [Candidatus Limnocylindrales bacterium]|nr:type II CAAX endopeptidase family protein [Candidatus Limnocylindrales bacterium]
MNLDPAQPGSPVPPAGPISTPGPRRTYRALHVASIVLILGGLGLVLLVLQTNAGLLSGDVLLPDAGAALGILALLLIGAAALLVGLVMNAVRSIVARETLPPQRYRGPSIIVMWLLATIAANIAVVSIASDLATLLGGGVPTLFGTIVTLTVTQAGLLAAVALLVYAPQALAGLRLLPGRGLLRSMLIGLGLAIPSWIGAQLIGYLTVRLLEPFGLQPEAGLAELALLNADPVVLVVALVVVAPMAEEVFFRGAAFNAWEREYGTTRALYGSALMFAAVHGSIFFIPSIAALGIVLGLLYRSTRSLPATMVLHAAFNGITLTIALLSRFNVIDIPIT